MTSITCIDLSDCENTHSTYQSQVISKVARSWEFPVAIRYHFSRPSLRPYVEGGFSYNHISGVFANSGGFYNPRAPLPQHVESPGPSSINRSGFLLGAGVEMKLPILRMTPGVRYGRYDIVENALPQNLFTGVNRTVVESPNAFDFVLGFETKR